MEQDAAALAIVWHASGELTGKARLVSTVATVNICTKGHVWGHVVGAWSWGWDVASARGLVLRVAYAQA